MTIEILADRYFECFWFAHIPGGDLHGALYQDKGQPWVARYRLRYYAETDSDAPFGDPFDGRDRKSWYQITGCSGSSIALQRKKLVELFETALRTFAVDAGLGPDEIDIDLDVADVRSSDPEIVGRILKGQSYVHVQLQEEPPRPTGPGGGDA